MDIRLAAARIGSSYDGGVDDEEDLVDPTQSEIDPKGRWWGGMGSGILYTADDHNGKRHILLMKRGPGVHLPHTWGIPGGMIPFSKRRGQHLDPWESAVKETTEEVGRLPPGMPTQRPATVHEFRDGQFKFLTHVVHLPTHAMTSWWPRLNWEHYDHGWFHEKNLPEGLHPGIKWLLDNHSPFRKK